MSGAGIYCIETTHWERAGTPQPSVRHMLRLLESIDGTPFKHRTFTSWEELSGLLVQATRESNDGFPVLYLASHGTDYGLTATQKRGGRNRSRSVDLAELATPLRGRGAGRVLFLSACEMMRRRSASVLRSFLAETDLEAVMGYGREVTWLESTQLELGLLSWLCHGFDGKAASLDRTVKRATGTQELMRRLDLRLAKRSRKR
jgi:hypothetical protein